MNMLLFWLFVVVLQVVCLWMGYRASKRHTSQSEYYLAGKRLTFFPLMMTFIATQVGGGLILGSAEEAYRNGWKIILYPLGAISGFFILSSSLGSKLASLPVSTVAQIFEVTYGSKTLKKFASLLSVLTLLMITVAQVLASEKFLASFNLDASYWLLPFWVVVFIYTMWGGMEGIASIDIIQASFFLIVFGVSVFLVDGISISQFMADSAPIQDGTSSLVGWFLMPCMFMLIEQDMAQRCFSAKSPGVMRRAALGAAILVFLVCLVPIYFGLMGRAQGIQIPQNTSVFLAIVQQTTPSWVSAIVACAVMMAIISTAVSLIHSMSSNLMQDFEFSWNQGPAKVKISKGITLIIGLTALGISRFFGGIVELLIQSYELSVVCLFVPVLMSLFQKKGNVVSATLAVGFGAKSFLLCRLFPVPLPRELIELAASGAGFYLGSVFYLKGNYSLGLAARSFIAAITKSES